MSVSVPKERQREQVEAASIDVQDEVLIPVQSRTRALLEQWLPPIIAFVVLIAAWIGSIRLWNISRFLLPSPGDVARSMADNHDELLTALRSTAQDAALGLGLSIVIGVLLAVIVAQSKLLDRAIFPYLTVAQTIPIFAIAPLIDYAVSGGHTAIVLVSLIIAVFPMIANTALGLNSVDNNQVNLFRMYNANRWQELIHLRLPFSIPYMLTGIRVSSGLAIIGAIVGQVLLGNGGPDGGGLGYEIQYSAHQGDYSWLLAAAVVAALLGIVVFIVLGALSNLALRNWHESAVQQEN